MCNIKNQAKYFNVITGDNVSGESYGKDAAIFKKVDNIDLVFDYNENTNLCT